MSEQVQPVTAEQFEQAALGAAGPVVVDFWAPWCGPCRFLSPVIDELSEEMKGQVQFYKINTDEEQELASVFGIRSIPSLLFIPKSGKPMMAAGALPKNELLKVINENLLANKTETV